MGARKILRRKTAQALHRHGERVSHDQRRGGARGRREVVRAGLALHAGVQTCVGFLSQRGVGLAGQRDQAAADALDDRQNGNDFGGLARIGNDQRDVLGGDHAEVAVPGLARMHKKRRRAGARQRGGDLAADVPGFPHADDHHAPAALQQQFAGARKSVSDPRAERGDRLRLYLYHRAGV